MLVALAWPDRIAQRRGGERRYRLSGGGGAISSVDGNSYASYFANSTFVDNTTGGKGGAILVSTRAEFLNLTFVDNTATGGGGAIHASYEAAVANTIFGSSARARATPIR